MFNTTLRLLVCACVTLSASAWAVDITARSNEKGLGQWQQTALYEPCMNGGVSAGGLYPSQMAEDKWKATLGLLAN